MRIATMCFKCKHFDRQSNGIKPLCTAFPEGIPSAIFTEGFDHRKPYDGDNGIRFEAKSEAGEEIVKTFFGVEPRPEPESSVPEFDEEIRKMFE